MAASLPVTTRWHAEAALAAVQPFCGVSSYTVWETAPTSAGVKEIFDDNALPFTVRVVGTAPTSEADGI